MNYLAHAYLSFKQPEILVGNMISDFVKGKKKFDYPPGIQKGIALHREIDNFTDTHPATHAAKELFRAPYRLYAGAIMDVLYDHFLATDKKEFLPGGLAVFSQQTYTGMEPYMAMLPERFRQLFPYMRQQDWLNNYQYFSGMRQSLAGLVRRSAYLTESDTAFRLFEAHYTQLQGYYNEFFPEVKKFAGEQLGLL